jgi:choline dehydrogenase-like flavoprotein
MDHPRDTSCLLVPADRTLFHRAGFYEFHSGPAGFAMGRLALTDCALHDERLANASAQLVPSQASPRAWARGQEEGRLRRTGRGLVRVLRRSATPFDSLRVLINLEQLPEADNRVTLDGSRDALGLPRARVHWRWSATNQQHLERVRALIADDVRSSGIGRLVIRPDAPIDPNMHHHMGTTRMHADPRLGVVNEHGRVHGVSNLFVAGASVFPSGGHANPTLTIVALACRLADYLKSSVLRVK